MRSIAVLMLLATLVTSATSCARQEEEHKYTLYVFGTLVEFTLYGVTKEAGNKAIAKISAKFQEMHRKWHAWENESTLSGVNDAFRKGEPLAIGPLTWREIVRAKRFEKISGGLFNPAIGKLIALWGFHSDEKPTGPPPSKADIKALVDARPSMRDVTIKPPHYVRSTNPMVQLDFGGFAKGAALDWAAWKLKKEGIKNAIINAGGDLNVIGRHGQRPWKIGIKHPVNWGVIASVELGPDEALYTSGNYYRFKEFEGKRYSHILDPRTGWPVDHIISATVIHKNGALADAAATALSVAGPTGWVETARNMGLTHVLLVDKRGGLYMTPKMQQRLVLTDATTKIIEVKDPFAGNQL